MTTKNFRRESVNTVTVELDGTNYRIHGESEITLREERSIRAALATAETIDEAKENLRFYERTINVEQARKATGGR